MSRRVLGGVAIALAAGLAAAAAWGQHGSGPSKAHAVVDRAASVETITERTIISQQLVDGTLGFGGAASVLQPVGASPDAVRQADEKTVSAEHALDQARADLAGNQATLAYDIQVGADYQKVDADQKAVVQGQGAVTGAEQSLSFARSAAAEAHGSALSFGPASTYTVLPAVGQVLHRSDALFAVNAQPIPLLYGTAMPWRPFRAGMSGGADVAALNQNLADLGYGAGLAGSDQFSSGTAAAIRNLQATLGIPRSGELLLGSVVFQPGPVRVTSVAPKVGAAVQPGAPVVDVTSTARQVTVKLDAAQQSQVEVGDAVVITLPNKKTTAATVTAVGTVATEAPPSGADARSNNQPTVDVVITPTDSAATGNLDAAPVQVAITTASVDHALVVPVTALLALGGGGYSVDIVSTKGVHHLEPVTLGLFDDAQGLVQITGANVHVGDRVAVATS